MEILEFNSIKDVNPVEWDSINSPEGLFFTHRFLQTVEISGVESAKFWYLLFYSGDRLFASAVLSAFVISLDLLLPISVQKACTIIRRVFPKFMRINTLFCGLPISVGMHTIVISDPSMRDEVLDALAAKMEVIAKEEKIKYSCLKEFPISLAGDQQVFEKRGYFLANSIPNLDIKVAWNSYQDYLESMRHGYRRQIKKNIRKMGYDPSKPLPGYSSFSKYTKPKMARVDTSICPPERFHELYMEVMDHTVTKLEILNVEYFIALYEQLKDELIILAVFDGESILGAVLLTEHDNKLTFLFAGIDYRRRDEHDVYMNLLHAIVAFGISKGFDNIDVGQTSYWVKQRIGGVPTEMVFWFKSDKPLTHKVLSTFKHIIFPKVDLQKLRVFRNNSFTEEQTGSNIGID